ncbi:MAG: flavodoxin [Lachnospiraceae bacterium]
MKRALVLYFSVYGTARKTAEEIARQTGADLREIVPKEPYDSNRDHYSALARRAKSEHDRDARPEIAEPIDISEYDTIFLGYPMWWYTFPMILYTLFDALDFTGKTIIPFNTHMGSGDGGTYRTIQELEPGAKVLEGLPIEMSDAEHGAKKEIAAWLSRVLSKEREKA